MLGTGVPGSQSGNSGVSDVSLSSLALHKANKSDYVRYGSKQICFRLIEIVAYHLCGVENLFADFTNLLSTPSSGSFHLIRSHPSTSLLMHRQPNGNHTSLPSQIWDLLHRIIGLQRSSSGQQ
jgi:hypothetical protein